MLNVVKEQITRALDKKQLPPSLENFRQNLSNCFYDHLFLQVLNVVKEQITRALDKKQLPPSLENFRQNLSNCSYDHLKQIWEMERKTTEEKEAQARPILYVCLFVFDAKSQSTIYQSCRDIFLYFWVEPVLSRG